MMLKSMGLRARFIHHLRGIGALGIVGLVLGVAACSDDAEVATVPDSYLEFDGDGIVFGMELWLTQDGVDQGRVFADTAFRWQDSAAVHLRGVDLTVMEEDGTERALVTARTGVLDTRTNRMTAHGNVVMVVPGEGRRIESEELQYDPQGDQIWSDSAFVYTVGSRVTRGRAFRSDLEFRNFRIVGRGGS
jgi:LPS export ABC transporter protein LptC